MESILRKFFYPSSICVAGASSKEKSIGYELLRSIKNYGFCGDVFPVNPKSEYILGYKCYGEIKDITEKIDLALIAVPKPAVEETIDSLLSKGVKALILVTAGFRETGEEGAELERRIADKIKNNGARLVGPNCMGIITTFSDISLNATFVAEKPETGKTAFLSQSGAVGAAVLNSLRETDIRFGHFISVGNKADISENDLLEYWQGDEMIDTITFYLESFVNGEDFILNFAENKITKPVIILKAGRTSEGIKAASSHTGALGSSDRTVSAVLNQFGIIRAETLNELFNTSKGLENFPSPRGKRIAVVTTAGGPAILAVDAIGSEGLNLAVLQDETKEKLRKIVRPEGSVQNPVDLLPGGTADQFKAVNEIVLKDENVDAVVSVFVEPVMVPAFDVVEGINSIESGKPVLQVVMPLPEFWEKYRRESNYKKPLFRSPEDPAKVISNMLFYGSKRKGRAYLRPSNEGNKTDAYNGFVKAYDAERLMSDYGIPVVKSITAEYTNLEEAAGDLEYPLVLKGISPEASHKTEMNAVRLNILNIEQLTAARDGITASFKANRITLENFLLQPYLKTRHELLIGGFRDPSFGPMIMFGTGGKYVEYYEDTAIKSAYMCEEDIDEIINGTKIGKILKGVRGEKPADLEKIRSIIRAAAQLMLDNRDIKEFDINPLIVTDDGGIFAVDVRVKI